MKTTWDILKKELAVHGFRLADEQNVEFYAQSELRRVPIDQAIAMVDSEVKDNIATIKELWKTLAQSLSDSSQPNNQACDCRIINLFIFSLKDLAKLLACFDPEGVSRYHQVLKAALDRDISSFNKSQIDSLLTYKISIDWTHRLIHKLMYIRSLLRFAKQGRFRVSNHKIVTASGVSGPWANLDLPMGERMWNWWEEDENFRGRDLDLRKQRRYRKGLENYNNDGSVGDGHYWRELRNEAYSWDDREDESPYPFRSTLWH